MWHVLLAIATAGTRVKRRSKASAAVERHVEDVSIRRAIDSYTSATKRVSQGSGNGATRGKGEGSKMVLVALVVVWLITISIVHVLLVLLAVVHVEVVLVAQVLLAGS